MKISLSRKGVDSGVASGRMASPILPCACLCSIPIPYASDLRYSDIRFGRRTLQQICCELNPNWSDEFAHLDPDLRHDALASRPPNWRPAFGQSEAAAGHLINQEIRAGDLFIFFGWFRRTMVASKKLEFDPADSHGRHIVFGWLEVGEVVKELPLRHDLSFLKHHPHVSFFEQGVKPNRIYVSSKSGLKAGVFSKDSDGVVLTQEGRRRSQWLLDKAFESLLLKRDLTYHGNVARWDREDEKIRLQAATRGQEFVFDGDRHPGATSYFTKRISRLF